MSAARHGAGPVLLAAGGTGGHLFPAGALAAALAARGIASELITDARGTRYSAAFPGLTLHVVDSDTVRGRSPVGLLRTAGALASGFMTSRRLIRERGALALVGFGGYPTVPPTLAAMAAGLPTILHEQNAVMGKANRFLARRVACVASGFPLENPAGARRVVTVGNPVRPAVLEAAALPYAPPGATGEIRLLVFGGSQGARVMGDVVPDALAGLPQEMRARLRVVLQARESDVAYAGRRLVQAGIEAEVAPFFEDMPRRIAEAHLVIARAGASTVTELAVIGRPAILVPFPHAQEHQAPNAKSLKNADAAIVMAQSVFTPEALAESLAALAAEPGRLAAMAAAARSVARPDAAERLADLVIEIVSQK